MRFQKLNTTYLEEKMKDKKDYSRFYASMVIILSVILAVVVITGVIEDVEFAEHLESDLKFAKETGEFIVYEAEIISFCANMSNISNNELLTKFLKYKADWINRKKFANEVLQEQNE